MSDPPVSPGLPGDLDVVVFMTDQQRGVTLDPAHPLTAITPRLDRFAEQATRFARCLAPSPHCCPSRTSFFTGLQPSEHGVWNNVNVPNALSRGPRPGTPFWSEPLAAAGRELAFAGKWHVSASVGPSAYGWRELHPIAGLTHADGEAARQRSRRDRIDALRDRPMSLIDDERGPGAIVRPGWPRFTLYGVDEDPFGDAAVVDHAVSFLAGRDGDAAPCVLYVGTLGPHDPYTPPQRFLDLYDPDTIALPPSFADPMIDKPALYRRTRDRFDQLTETEHREALRAYLAFCSYEDELFGRVLDAVEASGRADRTVIVYLSDHGDYTAEHGLWGKGLPSFEPAYHVPLVISVPGVTGGTVVDERVGLIDLGPTIAELCGVEIEPVTGRSLVPALRGERLPERPSFSQSNGNEVYGIQRIVRDGRWKLVMNLFDDDELYDHDTDPDELVNLIARPDHDRRVGVDPLIMVPPEHRAVVERLYGLLWQHAVDHDDDLTNPYILTALASFGPMPALSDD